MLMNNIEKYINEFTLPENFSLSTQEQKELNYLRNMMYDKQILSQCDMKRLSYLSNKSFMEQLHNDPTICDDDDWIEILKKDFTGESKDLKIKTCQIDTNPYIIIINDDGVEEKRYFSSMSDAKLEFLKPFIKYWFGAISSASFYEEAFKH